MRIGINASFLRKPYTGIGQVTLHTIESLPRVSGREYVVYYEGRPNEGPQSNREDIIVRSFLPLFWKRDDLVRKFLWERCLARRAQKDSCDFFVSLYQSATIMPEAIRHTMVVHDMIPRLFPQYLDNIRKRFYQRQVEKAIGAATRLVTVSEWSRNDISQLLGIPKEKISVAMVGVDPEIRKPVSEERRTAVLRSYGISAGYIYYGGGLELRKNVMTLLRAYRHMIDSDQDHREIPPLVISGKLMPQLAPLVTDIEHESWQLNLGPRVKILGFIRQEDVPVLYSGAKLFVYPSVYEGFGMPVLEAFCQGAPVLCSDASSLPEVGGDAAEYFHPNDVAELADKMRKLIDDSDRRHELSLRGRERSEQFSWESFVSEIFREA